MILADSRQFVYLEILGLVTLLLMDHAEYLFQGKRIQIFIETLDYKTWLLFLCIFFASDNGKICKVVRII